MLIPDLTDIPELTAVEEGEYDLRVIKATEKSSKRTGRPAIGLLCEIVGEDNAENVFHDIWLPMESDDENKTQIMWRMVKEFLVALGLPVDGISDLSVFEDLEFSALLIYEDTDQDGEPLARPRNSIKRIT